MSVVAVSQHNKNPTESISPVQSGHNYHLIEGNLFRIFYLKCQLK